MKVKQYEYKGSTFKIKVELNTRIEKSLNGRRWHTIFLEVEGEMLIRRDYLDDSLLLAINNFEDSARSFIDGKLANNKPPSILTNLGFVDEV